MAADGTIKKNLRPFQAHSRRGSGFFCSKHPEAWKLPNFDHAQRRIFAAGLYKIKKRQAHSRESNLDGWQAKAHLVPIARPYILAEESGR